MTSSQKSEGQSSSSRINSSNSISKSPALFLAVFLATFLAYILLLTRNYYWDGIFFAQTIENAPWLNATLIHPNHLLDMPLHYLVYRTVLAAGLQPRALTVMQVSNCILGAAAVSLFLRICLESFKSTYVALVTTALFAFSATWWRFSTDANNYILAVLLLLACFYLALPNRQPRPFQLALVHTAALLIHQLTVLFFPVAIIALLFQTAGQPRDARVKSVAKYALTVVPLTALVYITVFYLATGSLSVTRFANWITHFSPEHGFTFGFWDNLTVSLRSQLRVVFGGRISFVRDLWGPVMIALLVATLLFVLAFFIGLLRRLSEVKPALLALSRVGRTFGKLTVLCGAWITVYVIFLFFFIPQNSFYRLLYLPPLLLMAGAYLATIERTPNHVRRYRAALFVAALFFSNLTMSQYPYTQTAANPPLQLALKMNQHWSTGTTVYYLSSNSDNLLVRYFNPQTVWVEVSPDVLTRDLIGLPAHLRTGWLETTLIDQLEATAEGKAWLQAHAITQSDYELVNRKYRIRFRQLNAASFIEDAK